MNSLYAEVTKTILEQLQAGATPWRKDWRSMPSAGIPYNAATSRPYSGANVVLLWLKAQQQGWSTLQFLTFKLARELGGNIKHGEKSTIVVFVKQLMVKDRKNEGETKLVPMLKAYRVFHVSQCEGLPEKVTNPVTKLPRNKHVRDALVDGFVASTRADVGEGHGEPAYHPAGDYVSMPRFADFKNGDGFYSTLFHELIHWTGHKARCGRDLKSRFGDLHAYAAEELTAEIGASFLAAEFGLDNTKLQHAAYLAGWIKLLKHDRRAFFTAASKAQQAADYLRSLALADQPVAA